MLQPAVVPHWVSGVDDGFELMRDGGGVVLSGAGLSTDSGIPDYRGLDSPPRTPMTYGEFVSGVAAQRRYWARSHAGWARMRSAHPNAGHRAVAQLEHRGLVDTVITQNVDGLHEAAGSHTVIELHGRVADVVCLGCGTVSGRELLAERLDALNPGFTQRSGVQIAPDGDAIVADVGAFRFATCQLCGGPLKPDVVFFGENVPKARVERAYALVAAARVLLVLGSSLTVQSGLRLVRRAYQQNAPVLIVNRGLTRGDEYATVKIDAGCSRVLSRWCELMGGADPA